MATFATLPGDLLTAIASYVDTPHFVVAVASDADARVAVVAHRVGWVDLENEPWCFFSEIARSWFCSVLFCFVVAHGIVVLCDCSWRDRKEAIRTVQVAAIYAIYPLLVLKVARMGGVALPPLMQWWFTSNGSLWAYLISFALQLSLHFVMRDRKEAE